MGVQGLWQGLSVCGRRIDIQTLRGNRLAVDASIWITQFIKAMRDSEGNIVKNAHITGTLFRILKLLTHKIKPIFVFDGGVPVLKKRVMQARNQKAQMSATILERTAQKLLLNSLAKAQVEKITGKVKAGPQVNLSKRDKQVVAQQSSSSSSTDINHEPVVNSGLTKYSDDDDDDFDIDGIDWSEQETTRVKPQPVNVQNQDDGDDPVDSAARADEVIAQLPLQADGEVDISVITNLPTQLQYEVLNRLKDKRRNRESKRDEFVPVAGDPQKYSAMQLNHFIKAVRLKDKLDTMEKNLTKQGGAGKKIASDSIRQYVLTDSSVDQNKQAVTSPRSPINILNGILKVNSQGKSSVKTHPPKQLPQGNLVLSFSSSQINAAGGKKKFDAHFRKRDSSGNLKNTHKKKQMPRDNTTPVLHQADLLNEEALDRAMSTASNLTSWASGAVERALSKRKRLGQIVKRTPSGALVTRRSQEEEAKSANGTILGFTKQKSEGVICFDDNGNTVIEVGEQRSTLTEKRKPAPVLSEERKDSPVYTLSEEEDTPSQALRPSRLDSPVYTLSEEEEEDIPTQGFKLSRVDSPIHTLSGEEDTPTQELKPSRMDSRVYTLSDEECSTSQELKSSQVDSSVQALSQQGGVEEKEFNRLLEQGTKKKGLKVDAPVQSLAEVHNPVDIVGTVSDEEVGSKRGQVEKPVVVLLTEGKDEQTALANDSVVSLLNEGPDARKVLTADATSIKKHTDVADMDSGSDSDFAIELLGSKRNDSKCSPTGNEPNQVDVDLEIQKSKDAALRKSRASAEQEAIEIERKALLETKKHAARDAEKITPVMIEEVKELLELFRLPYIQSPMEAEAQCAELEASGLVDGIVTDDCDAFLFGAKKVFKNIFDEKKFMEAYSMDDIKKDLGLDREDLIHIALLLGSDYTKGIKGIGFVNAVEIIAAFGKDMKGWREWVQAAEFEETKELVVLKNGKTVERKKKKRKVTAEDGILDVYKIKHDNIRRKWMVSNDFPSDQVVSAYKSPIVDSTQGVSLSFKEPDIDGIRRFCSEKLEWDTAKTDSHILRPIQEYNSRNTQTTLTNFLSFTDNKRQVEIRSTRMSKALGIAKEKTTNSQ